MRAASGPPWKRLASPSLLFELILEIAPHEEGGAMPASLVADTSSLFSRQPPFATFGLAWAPEAILFYFKVDIPPEKSSFVDFRQGDSIELFIATRHLKQARSPHRFCHHFLALPLAPEGENCFEITRFRGGQGRPLANPKELPIEVESMQGGYVVRGRLAREVLYGYDPDQFSTIGLCYQVNRCSGPPQYLNVDGGLWKLEHHPDLWAEAHLVGSGRHANSG